MYNDDQDLSETEVAALAALPRELAPSDLLEERVVHALRSEGHFGASRKINRTWMNMSLRIAAAAALFIGGVATGEYMMTRAATQTADAAALIRQANALSSTPAAQPAQTAKTSEKIVAEREMWL
ncbi:MAG: hypothetical protein ACRD3J_12210 [Thermoanaerobaculia bacterium]